MKVNSIYLSKGTNKIGKSKQRLIECQVPRANLDLSSQQQQGSKDFSFQGSQQQSNNLNNSQYGTHTTSYSSSNLSQLSKYRSHSQSKITKTLENGLGNNNTSNMNDSLCNQSLNQGRPLNNSQLKYSSSLNSNGSNNNNTSQLNLSVFNPNNLGCNSPSNLSQISLQNGFSGINNNNTNNPNLMIQSVGGNSSINYSQLQNSSLLNQSSIGLGTPISLNSQISTSLYNGNSGIYNNTYSNTPVLQSQQSTSGQGFGMFTMSKQQQYQMEQIYKCVLLSSYKEASKIIEQYNITVEDIYSFKEKNNENIILHSLAVRQDSSTFLKYLDTHMTIDFNMMNNLGQTPLMLACMKGNYDVARFLVSHKSVDINAQDLTGSTALHYSCQYGQRKMVEMLLQQKQIQSYIKNNDDKQPKDLTQDSKIISLFNKFRKVNLDQSYSSGSATMNVTLNNINNRDITNTSIYKDSPRTNSRSRQNAIYSNQQNSQNQNPQLQRSYSNSSHSTNLQSLQYNFVNKLNKSATKNTYLTLKQALNSQNQPQIQIPTTNNRSNPNSNKNSSLNSPIVKSHHSPNIHLHKAKSAIHSQNQNQQYPNSPTDFILKGITSQLNDSSINAGKSESNTNKINPLQAYSTTSQVLNNSISLNYFDKNYMTPLNIQNNSNNYLYSEGNKIGQSSIQASLQMQQNQQFNESMNALYNTQPFSESKNVNNFLQQNTNSLNNIANQIVVSQHLAAQASKITQNRFNSNQYDIENGSLNYITNTGILDSIHGSNLNIPQNPNLSINITQNMNDINNAKKGSQPNLNPLSMKNIISNISTSGQKIDFEMQSPSANNITGNDSILLNSIQQLTSPSRTQSYQYNQHANYKNQLTSINTSLSHVTAKTQCNSPVLTSYQMQNHISNLNKINEKKQRSRSQNQLSKGKLQTPSSENSSNPASGNSSNSNQQTTSTHGNTKISTFGTNAAIACTPVNKDKTQDNKRSSDSNDSTNNTLQNASSQALNNNNQLKTQSSLSINGQPLSSASTKANFFNSQNPSTKKHQLQSQNSLNPSSNQQSTYNSPQLSSTSQYQLYTPQTQSTQLGHFDQLLLNSQQSNNFQLSSQNLLKQIQSSKNATTNYNQTLNTNQQQNFLSNPSNQPNFSGLQYGLEIYQVLTHLGSGNYGDVYLVETQKKRKRYAMKLLDKEKLVAKNMMKYAIAERNVMQKCNSPFIVKMHHSFQTDTHLVIIMDYCPGGDLYTYLLQKKRNQFFQFLKQRFDEELAMKYLSEILLAVEELHYHDVIYRDMKPENIVLGSDGHVKLIDFGLSRENIGEGVAQSFCGSAVYLAPEIISKKGHNKSVDWYQYGVLAYELMVGQPPFNQLNRKELYFHIQNKKVEYPSYLSTKAKNLISALLNKNPEERLGSGRADAQQIKDHPFFETINWFDVQQKQYNVLLDLFDRLFFDLPKPTIANPIKDPKFEFKLPKLNLKEPLNVPAWYHIDEVELF